MDTPPHHAWRLAANIPRYYAYIALKGLGIGLFIAVWVIYLQQRRGLGLAQAALVDATYFVIVALFEIPTGMVADRWGRKASLAVGAFLMIIGGLGWAFAPTLPLILLAYVVMGAGQTLLSGAEDALFYESVRQAGRGQSYSRLLGRAQAALTGALGVGTALGGLLGALDLLLPYLAAALAFTLMLAAVLTFREPGDRAGGGAAQKSFGALLRASTAVLRARPALRYPMFYLALVPLPAVLIDAVFVQPQALALGVPIAGIGVVVLGTQLSNMLGAGLAERVKLWLGEARVLALAPALIAASLVLLAAFQALPALLLILAMGFCTALLRPIVLNRIQRQIDDATRATVISMQSLLFTVLGAAAQPSLGLVADRAGLPAAYLVLAGGVTLLGLLLFWKGRPHLLAAAPLL